MEATVSVQAGWKRRLKRRVGGLLGGLGLLPFSFRLRGLLAPLRPTVFVRNARYWGRLPDDGRPLPSTRARFLVAGSADITWFLEGGRLGYDSIRETLERNGCDIASLDDILDFGCGCGRVLRHWAGQTSAALHGVDQQPLLIDECRRILPEARFSVNGPEPPLPFADSSIDLAYCLSVFTHMNDGQQKAWRDEVHRVLRPGGLWLFTTQGPAYLDRLDADDQRRFGAGQIVCHYGRYRGENFCQTFHPERYVRDTLAAGFSVVDYVPTGARGNPVQDLYLLRRDGG